MGTMDGGGSFVAYLDEVRPIIDEALVMAARVRPCHGSSADADLGRYLYEPLTDFAARGGKRVRPALALLGAEAVGAEGRRALSAAVALEQFQTAALVHDDIADEGELRRGAPCLHVSEGVGIAINVGDAALTSMFAGVLRDGSLSVGTRLAVLDELAAMSERTLEGQALDLGWARDGRWDVSVDDYLHMATCKTAHYSAATPLVVGALCGGGSREQVEVLRSFGLAAGLAFQLQDDLLNIAGDAAMQGKDLRSDITEGKRTLMAVYALSHLPSVEAAELEALLSAGTVDQGEQTRAVALMEAAGALDYARGTAAELAGVAKGSLVGSQVVPAVAGVLQSMADFFVERVA